MIKKIFKKIFYYLGIALSLHSKSPTEEIKNNWKIFVIGGFPVALLTLFCGEKILWFLNLPKIEELNAYGGFIFFIFIVVFVIVFFDYKKCGEITAKNSQKQPKT